jgi:hypothetical protein
LVILSRHHFTKSPEPGSMLLTLGFTAQLARSAFSRDTWPRSKVVLSYPRKHWHALYHEVDVPPGPEGLSTISPAFKALEEGPRQPSPAGPALPGREGSLV